MNEGQTRKVQETSSHGTAGSLRFGGGRHPNRERDTRSPSKGRAFARATLWLFALLALAACDMAAQPGDALVEPPTRLEAFAYDGAVELRWNASRTDDVTYTVYRGTSSNPRNGGRSVAEGVTGLQFLDEDVSNGSTYHYVVTAVDAEGRESRASNEVNARPTADGGEPGASCYPYSELPCSALAPSLPFSLDFSGNEGGLADTGFTMALPSSDATGADPNVTGFDPSRLRVTGGDLVISTTAGIKFADNNDQLNALGVGLTGNEAIRIDTTITLPAIPSGNFQQFGSWFGSSEEDYVKLVVIADGSNRARVQLQREVAGASTDAPIDTQRTAPFSVSQGQTVTLSLVVSPSLGGNPGYATALFTRNGQEQMLGSVTLPEAFFANGSAARPSRFAGVFATHRNASSSMDVRFSSFEIEELTGQPRVTGIRPAPGATGVARRLNIGADLLLPNAGIDLGSITDGSVRLVQVGTGQTVSAQIGSSGGFDSITIDTNELLAENTTYRIEITEGARDQSGARLVPFASTFTTGTQTGATPLDGVAFDPQVVHTGRHITSLAIGPDGRLYATTVIGEILRWTIANDGTLTNETKITSLQQAEGGPRLTIGLAFDPSATANNLVAWVSHTQFHFGSDDAQDWTGKITRLSGANLQNVQDFVVGLPRSNIDHVTNSIAFGPDGAMYVPQGSNSGMGAPDGVWGWRPERLLTAAVLRIDHRLITNPPVNVKTEDGGTYDPLAQNAPVTIYATGVRNAYDLVWHSNGRLYVPTNASAAGNNVPRMPAGDLPAMCDRRIDGSAYSGAFIDHQRHQGNANVFNINATFIERGHGYRLNQTPPDFLFRVEQGGYYGHPAPIRCEWIMNGGNNNQSTAADRINQYQSGTPADPNYRGYAFAFPQNASSNGVIEYRSNTFGGALQGKLLVARFAVGNDLIVLEPGGSNGDIVASFTGTPGMTGFLDPLTLVENPRDGSIYVAEFARNVSGLGLQSDGTYVGRFSGISPDGITLQNNHTGPRITLLRPINP